MIPAILGRKVNTLERDMLALPLRHEGIFIQNPAKTADREYDPDKLIKRAGTLRTRREPVPNRVEACYEVIAR